MSLDFDKLEKVCRVGDGFRARCPACAEAGADRKGDHLAVYADGRYGCAVNPGDGEHRKRIFALVGMREDRPVRASAAGWSKPKATTPTPQALPGDMPADVRKAWDEGVATLAGDPTMCRRIDTWRGWPDGLAEMLAGDGVIGAPLVYGRRTIAFPVQSSYVDELGSVGVREIGFHSRHKPREGERPSWTFHPKGTPALPFVLGAGFAPTAHRVIVAEGQWDGIIAALALGLLNGDTGFDEHSLVLATRGANGWRAILDHWVQHVASGARWTLIRDNDTAGESFLTFAAELRRMSRDVRVLRIAGETFKDLNDLYREAPQAAAQFLT